MKKEIVSIYENIYNQELNWKANLDNKFASRLTILMALVTASFVIFKTLFFPEESTAVTVGSNNITFWCKIFNLVEIMIVACIAFSFYRCFFRIKLLVNLDYLFRSSYMSV